MNTGSDFGWSPATSRVSRSITIWTASVARIMTNIVARRSQSGRTTIRSTSTPKAATTMTATAAAASMPQPVRTSMAWVIIPPSITKAPWAKFTSPLAL